MSTCDYNKRTGRCGRRCFGDRCNLHKGKESQRKCPAIGCTLYTVSKTGYCNKCGPGVNGYQQSVRCKNRRAAAAAAAAAAATAAANEAYLTSLLNEIYPDEPAEG